MNERTMLIVGIVTAAVVVFGLVVRARPGGAARQRSRGS
jgi:hypothetical protein